MSQDWYHSVPLHEFGLDEHGANALEICMILYSGLLKMYLFTLDICDGLKKLSLHENRSFSKTIGSYAEKFLPEDRATMQQTLPKGFLRGTNSEKVISILQLPFFLELHGNTLILNVQIWDAQISSTQQEKLVGIRSSTDPLAQCLSVCYSSGKCRL